MAPGYSCCGWMLLSVLCTMGRCLVISSLLGGGNPEIQSVVFFFFPYNCIVVENRDIPKTKSNLQPIEII